MQNKNTKSLLECVEAFIKDCKEFDPKNDVGRDYACLKKSIERFCESGSKEDAFCIYFCYAEIFKIFGKGYDATQKLVELLADHEYHAGGLLSKHRDHYSHSAYVFLIGLSIYAKNEGFRKIFNDFYSLGEEAYNTFLYLWGMTALFHDVGYPFQLAHEQIKTYSETMWGEKNPSSTYVSFGNLDKFLEIGRENGKLIRQKLHTDAYFNDINYLLAYGVNKRLGYDFDELPDMLYDRVHKEKEFMDHGYFSAVLLTKCLFERTPEKFDERILDVLSAVLLHNSLNKFYIPEEIRKRVSDREHPLAFLLMLCDELQNWDRRAFGYTSKKTPLAWDARFDISDGRVHVLFVFESSKITVPVSRDDVDGTNAVVVEEKENSVYYDALGEDFAAAIRKIVDTDTEITSDACEEPKSKTIRYYASSDNFINLCDFAKAVHVSYLKRTGEFKEEDYSYLESDERFASLPPKKAREKIEKEKARLRGERIEKLFSELTLEYKMSNIEQAMSYTDKLELINCLYSDKELDYEIVNSFEKYYDIVDKKEYDDLEFLCRQEHLRWVKEKLKMGWKYGTDYLAAPDKSERRRLREELHQHMDIVPYEALDEEERKKDLTMVNNMIPLLYDLGHNIRIYRYRHGRKRTLDVYGFGHRFFIADDEAALKAKIKAKLTELSRTNDVVVRTHFRYGADLLIAECAVELGLTIKGALYEDYAEHIEYEKRYVKQKTGYEMTPADELRMRHLMAQAVTCKMNPECGPITYVKNKCSQAIVLWDGGILDLDTTDENGKLMLINQDTTYHRIATLREKGLDDTKIHTIYVKKIPTREYKI